MSATNRSDVRRSNDTYITPAWCVRRFLEAYMPPEGGSWLDPCAASGELLTTVREIYPAADLTAVEVREECEEDLLVVTKGSAVIGDFLAIAPLLAVGSFDFLITNPPYSLQEPFIRAALRVATVSAWLLRINAIRGDGRERLFGEQKPGIFVLPNRPSFTGRGTDATEYAWFVFGDPLVSGKWQMLEETSAEERALWNRHARLLHPSEDPSDVLVAESATAA
jgi:hypothetical protein